MTNAATALFLLLTLVSYAQISADSINTVQYDSLTAIVRENGSPGEDKANFERIYESGNIRFSHKYIMKDMEALTVADFRTNIFYWVIKKNGKVFIETKDYTPDIAEKKYREAKIHFPGVLKNILKPDQMPDAIINKEKSKN